MSSILKVDQLQDSGGNSIISSNGSGTFTPGSLNIANAQIASDAAIATTKLGTGAVLQVQQANFAGNTNTSTATSYTDNGTQVSITPLSSSSKILVIADNQVYINPNSNNARVDSRLIENGDSTVLTTRVYIGHSTNANTIDAYTHVGWYSNSSTSQKTFKMQLRKANGESAEAGTFVPRWYSGATFNIIAMEIKG